MAITTPYVFSTLDDATATRMNTRSSAISELQSPPRCHAYQAVAQTLTTGVLAAVTLDGEQVDTNGIHSTSVNTSRMTIVTPGRYRCIGQATFASNATSYRQLTLALNGVDLAFHRANAVNGIAHTLQVYDEILCVAGDFIEMRAQQNSGGNLALVAASNATFLHVAWCSLT